MTDDICSTLLGLWSITTIVALHTISKYYSFINNKLTTPRLIPEVCKVKERKYSCLFAISANDLQLANMCHSPYFQTRSNSPTSNETSTTPTSMQFGDGHTNGTSAQIPIKISSWSPIWSLHSPAKGRPYWPPHLPSSEVRVLHRTPPTMPSFTSIGHFPIYDPGLLLFRSHLYMSNNSKYIIFLRKGPGKLVVSRGEKGA